MSNIDGPLDHILREQDAEDLARNIIKQCDKYNVKIGLAIIRTLSDRVIMEVKLKGNTREAHLRANMPDVKLKLRLPILYVQQYNYRLYIIASREKIMYDHLPKLLRTEAYKKAKQRMLLPYLVGCNVIGRPTFIDLSEQPHLLLGGSSNSGKSVGLQVAISSISYSVSPEAVNFVLIDLGANDLTSFGVLPHLACPIIQSRDTVLQTLNAVVTEMDRRKTLELSNKQQFYALPRLVVVIDEFPALFHGMEDKHISALLRDIISSLLQRGRHAKIHLVLAAQNPTYQNMKVDLSNITARIAFRCAKKNFSEVILGEGGAERLTAQGDLLMRASNYDGLQQVRGAYVTPDELGQLVQTIAAKWMGKSANPLTITNSNSCSTSKQDSSTNYGKIATQISTSDQLLARVLVWAIGENTVSVNQVQHRYSLGWNRANELVKKLESMGIVEQPMSKLPRRVVPIAFGDIPTEMREFLHQNGVTDDAVRLAISARDNKTSETPELSQRVLEDKSPATMQHPLRHNGSNGLQSKTLSHAIYSKILNDPSSPKRSRGHGTNSVTNKK